MESQYGLLAVLFWIIGILVVLQAGSNLFRERKRNLIWSLFVSFALLSIASLLFFIEFFVVGEREKIGSFLMLSLVGMSATVVGIGWLLVFLHSFHCSKSSS